MGRKTKGARLYLRSGRKDSRTGNLLPNKWFIRDGSIEISTGCDETDIDQAERILREYIENKYAIRKANDISEQPLQRSTTRRRPASIALSQKTVKLPLYTPSLNEEKELSAERMGDIAERFEVLIERLQVLTERLQILTEGAEAGERLTEPLRREIALIKRELVLIKRELALLKKYLGGPSA